MEEKILLREFWKYYIVVLQVKGFYKNTLYQKHVFIPDANNATIR